MVLVAGLESLRGKIARPVHVLSGLRCAKHNKAVGGVKNSQHLTGKAADIRVDGLTAKQLGAIVLDDPILSRGGVGVYPSKGFVHVDTRGYAARWVG